MPREREVAVSQSQKVGGRVAVLPFANKGSDQKDEYFADGVSEELIEKLSQVRQLEVVARASVMSYKKKGKKAGEIAKELHVRSLVEGTAKRAGDQIKVSVQLTGAGTEKGLWPSRYEGNLGGIFAFLNKTVEEVAGELGVQVSQPEREQLGKKPTENMEAYVDYLQGRELYMEGSEPSLRQALNHFEGAVKLDPSFARAHVAVAECHQRLASAGYEPYDAMLPAVMASLKMALKLDPDLAGAHVSLALLYLHEDNAPGVEAEAKRALELNPSLPEAYNILFDVAGIKGEPEEMVRNIEAAYRLDPIGPLYIEEVGQAYFHTGREQDALEHWKKTEHLNPAGTYRNMTNYYLSKGDAGKARKFLAKVEKLTPASPWVVYTRGYVDALAGEREKALLAIVKLEDRKLGPLTYNFVAYVYHALGDLDRYFESLNRALEEHAMIATFVMYSPLLAKARDDPRYGELVEKLRKMNGLAR
jgi:TolB-like protein/Tfp pilus assembly protein PilF